MVNPSCCSCHLGRQNRELKRQGQREGWWGQCPGFGDAPWAPQCLCVAVIIASSGMQNEEKQHEVDAVVY